MALMQEPETPAAFPPENIRLCSLEMEPAGTLAPEVQATTITLSLTRGGVGVNGSAGP
jgi:hypothetical protein